jgi:SAM-dependent methyltransferase
MALPVLTAAGTLPGGIHLATLAEIQRHFGDNTDRRRQVFAVLEDIYNYSIQAGINRILLGGSFVTAKDFPGDLDAVLLGSPESHWEVMRPFLSRGAQHRDVRVDVFPAVDPDQAQQFSQIYRVSRTGNDCGVVDLPIFGLAPELKPRPVAVEDWLLDYQIEQARERLKSANDSTEIAAFGQLIKALERSRARTAVSEFFQQCLQAEITVPAPRGSGDIQIGTLTGMFLGSDTPVTLVDFGCGQGRLMTGLLGLDPAILKKMTYIGVDFDTGAASAYAETTGFHRLCNRILFMHYDQLGEILGTADFVIAINVLHEIPLTDLPQRITEANDLLVPSGILVIHDMERLAYGERGFVTWSGEVAGDWLRSNGLAPTVNKQVSRSGIPLFTLVTRKAESELISHTLLRTAAGAYQKMARDLLQERVSISAASVGRARDYAYLSVVVANIQEQLLNAVVPE